MIVTVTLNAAIDKRYVIDDFRMGEVNRVRECTYTPGGKGLNVSRVLAIAGGQVLATGFTGGYAGGFIENALVPYQIKSGFFPIKGESRSCINIWDEKNRVQTELLEPGFMVSAKEYEEFCRFFTKTIENAEVVALSGSVPKGLEKTVYRDLVKMGKDAGKQVILDTSGELLRYGIEAKPTLIKPNIDEIRMLTQKKCESFEEICQAAKQLHQEGVAIVVISLGADGSLVVCEQGCFRACVPKIDAVNTVGCGDSMIAGFALGLEAHQPIEEILRSASAISAASAMDQQTGCFDPKVMKKLLPRIEIERLGSAE